MLCRWSGCLGVDFCDVGWGIKLGGGDKIVQRVESNQEAQIQVSSEIDNLVRLVDELRKENAQLSYESRMVKETRRRRREIYRDLRSQMILEMKEHCLAKEPVPEPPDLPEGAEDLEYWVRLVEDLADFFRGAVKRQGRLGGQEVNEDMQKLIMQLKAQLQEAERQIEELKRRNAWDIADVRRQMAESESRKNAELEAYDV